ncbi:MAG TPA: hypothetical protein V6D11_01405 [Waterburya sp.]
MSDSDTLVGVVDSDFVPTADGVKSTATQSSPLLEMNVRMD